MCQNDIFCGQNRQIWVKKGPKTGEKVFCQNFHWVIIVIYHKCSLNAKVVKSYEQIERNWPKCNFFGQNGQILVKKRAKKGAKTWLHGASQKIKQDKATIGSPEKSMTKQKLEEQVSNAIFYFFIQHDIKKIHTH